MEKYFYPVATILILALTLAVPVNSFSQVKKKVISKYLTVLPDGDPRDAGKPQTYRMTAIYKNMDIYGNLSTETKVTGDYTRHPGGKQASWNNVFVASVANASEQFPDGTRQDYMENFTYDLSADMVRTNAFPDFPSDVQAVFAKNLVWDMSVAERFAWDYTDSLKLNINYTIPIKGSFEMVNVGNYSHTDIQICWTGISFVNNKLCAVIEYRALNNIIELNMPQVTSKGTEQYWGTTWMALDTKQIEYAEMYSGTIQEIQAPGLADKMQIKTIREIKVDRIK